MQSNWQDFLTDEAGATAIEYGLIASLVVIAMLVGLTTLGGSTDGMWGKVSTKIGEALQSSPESSPAN